MNSIKPEQETLIPYIVQMDDSIIKVAYSHNIRYIDLTVCPD